MPEYQRPYRWSTESVNILFDDIWSALKTSSDGEYRLGSVVLHKENTGIYNIVDGQQRITTLAILFKWLIKKDDAILKNVTDLNYTRNSSEALKKNMNLIKSRVNELGIGKDKYLNFVKNNCTFVSIVTDSQSEAFQFFDSQNHRGKELDPHDLLKAFHLREMRDENEQTKIDVVNKWENYKEENLKILFSYHLYPLTQWYRGRDGIDYSSAKIKQFKGVKKDLAYDYILYHKAANIFVEDMNKYSREFNRKEVNQFQLTQPILSGTRFFRYVTHYMDLLEQVDEIIESKTPDDSGIIPKDGNGNKYVNRLFQNALMFYADRFGIEAITDKAYKKLFSFCYSIRLTMQAVYQQTINNYALGYHRNNVDGINIFERICEMATPEEISMIVVSKPENILEGFVSSGGKFEKLYSTVSEYCGWGE
ncbi:DUF262 domain-containing protein [Clostridium carboxidivorans]|uniref:DUF262 domain-containing protein n=1 Tax=Clostridium carboxidivorans TaxID=217159 RepID=UPI0012F4ED82|nr:DUF262 domain-containing protein [Clostridium carboxidivorans]